MLDLIAGGRVVVLDVERMFIVVVDAGDGIVGRRFKLPSW